MITLLNTAVDIIYTDLQTAIAGAGSWAAAGPLVMKLFQNNITPDEGTTEADLDVATFDGYANIAATMNSGIDPSTGLKQVTVAPASGGFVWETTGASNLPQTIYGAYLINDDPSLGYVFLFDQPVTLTGTGDQVVMPSPVVVIQPSLAT